MFGLLYRVQQKKWTPEVFAIFLAKVLDFYTKFLQLYLLKPSTSNCQVKCDSVEKRWSYRFFNM